MVVHVDGAHGGEAPDHVMTLRHWREETQVSVSDIIKFDVEVCRQLPCRKDFLSAHTGG